MITIFNKFIPTKGYKAITLYFLMFVRNESLCTMGIKDYTHEWIHSQQQSEILLTSLAILAILVGVIGISTWWLLLSIPMPFILYAVEWIVRLFIDKKTAYKHLSFEQEAYKEQDDELYFLRRNHFAWVKYLKTK